MCKIYTFLNPFFFLPWLMFFLTSFCSYKLNLLFTKKSMCMTVVIKKQEFQFLFLFFSCLLLWRKKCCLFGDKLCIFMYVMFVPIVTFHWRCLFLKPFILFHAGSIQILLGSDNCLSIRSWYLLIHAILASIFIYLNIWKNLIFW